MSRDGQEGQARTRRRIHPITLLLGAAGLALTVHLMDGAWPGLVRLVHAAGLGLFWVVPLRVAALGLDARGWWNLFPGRSERPAWPRLAVLAFIRDGINNILPVARVGGEMVAVRLLGQARVPMALAAASIVAETSLTLVLLMALTFAGLAGLLGRVGGTPAVLSMLLAAVAGSAVVAVFVVVQARIGLARAMQGVLARFFGDALAAKSAAFARFDQDVLAIYARRAGLWRCAGWQLAGLAGGMLELWWVLRLVRVPIGLGPLFILESLLLALQNLSFVVPAALGIQEGGFVILGSALGLGMDAALLLALVRRLRQVVTGLPALAIWWWQDGRGRRVLALAGAASHRRG